MGDAARVVFPLAPLLLAPGEHGVTHGEPQCAMYIGWLQYRPQSVRPRPLVQLALRLPRLPSRIGGFLLARKVQCRDGTGCVAFGGLLLDGECVAPAHDMGPSFALFSPSVPIGPGRRVTLRFLHRCDPGACERKLAIHAMLGGVAL